MIQGKGVKINPESPFIKNSFSQKKKEGIGTYTQLEKPKMEIFFDTPKKVISKSSSPDHQHDYSVNPYQGCEHGCVYCYARNTQNSSDPSAGLDFESKIIVKKDIAQNLANQFQKRTYKVKPIMLSGNTDCYQPLEREYKLTRAILEVALNYRHPISLMTKNALILKDLDLIAQLAKFNLIHVYFSISTLDDKMRQKLEPKTSTAQKKFDAMQILSSHKVPVGVMVAPVIPGLTDAEIPSILKKAARAGAVKADYNVIRLNGKTATIFEDWLEKVYPDNAEKIKNQIKALHDGHANDSNSERRMTGEGVEADIIKQLFEVSQKEYFNDKKMPPLETHHFLKGGNYSLF
ncbi:MAG: DNA repair photolyase [Cyclobacteriaceae bacterium]|jgi:DNA repair photolyase